MTPWADHVETHTGAVFFLGDLAVKVRKPVRFSFVDLSTAALRRRAAQEEVRLNRRLAPDVYLGVAEVELPGGGREPAVVMRRLPASRRLSTLVEHGGADLDAVADQLAERLARFHAGCAVRDDVGDPDHWRALWDDARAVLSAAPELVATGEVADLHDGAIDYVTGCAPLLASRAAAGRVRDGHGDLLADDIFVLDDGARILDCLDFDERLRCGDVLLDVAMLAMDLEHLGATGLARRLLAGYERRTGDEPPPSLEDFFLGYRAAVRAKVMSLRWRQGDTSAAGQVGALFALARRHVAAARPLVVLVGGLPGSGKTTVARALAAAPGWTAMSTDVVRRQRPATEDRYTPAERAAVYDDLLHGADAALAHGGCVVLDATWERDEWRARARELAGRRRATVVELRCEVPEDEAQRRLRARVGDASEADVHVRAGLATSFQPWPRAVTVTDVASAADAVRAARGCGSGDSGPATDTKP